MGLLDPTLLSERNRKTGILFSNTPQKSSYLNVYNNNRSLFEMMLGVSHGSADGYFSTYMMNKGERMKHGYISQTIDADEDHIGILLQDLPQERNLFLHDIKPIQDRIVKLISQFNKLISVTEAELPEPEWFARRHGRMVFHPKRREVNFFERLYHLENFGIFEFTDFKRQSNLSLKQRFHYLKALLKDPDPILETGVWPPIILRRLGLDILRPIQGMQRYRREFGHK